MKRELLFTTHLDSGWGGPHATVGCYRVAPAPTLDELDQMQAHHTLAWREPEGNSTEWCPPPVVIRGR